MISRREFLAVAASIGASVAWPAVVAGASRHWRGERRDLFPQGVASGDPHPDSVVLWTRRPPAASDARTTTRLTLELAAEPSFDRIIATDPATVAEDTDWTCRVLAVGLEPRRVYWYRFVDEHGAASRVGRTITAPAETDERPVRFTFVSCQNVNQGACTAYRRMIYEDERRARADQLAFVLHLGDFVYEVVWYPEDRPQGMYARRLRDVVRYPTGEKIADFHVPVTVEDYRALYRGYLMDPDLQDARARWPFICIWDNHEFSWKGWQSQQNFGGVRPAQSRKVAANQAWFEYQPARVAQPGKAGSLTLERFQPPAVSDQPIREFDEDGLGLESGNLAAIRSLELSRTLRLGRHVDLLLTDNRSFRSQPLTDRAEAAPFRPNDFPFVVVHDVVGILDAGRAYAGGHPPPTIRFNGSALPNPRRDAPPLSMLGAAQKVWFLERLRTSRATWKLWGNSVAMLDWRIDFQNLPPSVRPRWPAAGYAQLVDDDWSGYRHERAEILEFVRRERITGLVSLAGDRHAFSAGVVAPTPAGVRDAAAAEFVTGSVSAPGLFEAAQFALPKTQPLRGLYVYQSKSVTAAQPAINLLLRHGVRSALALRDTGDARQALAARNRALAPHLAFVDVGGHGYAEVCATASEITVEFVCIPRPLERSDRADGGPLAYRVTHRVARWDATGAPRLERISVAGQLPLGA